MYFQTLELTPQQVDWVTNHLGHSLDVHKISYRMTSHDLERGQIAKILLLQDHAQVGKWANKKLEDIDLHGKYHMKLRLQNECYSGAFT